MIAIIQAYLLIKEICIGDVIPIDEDKAIRSTGISGCFMCRITSLDTIHTLGPGNHILNSDPKLFFLWFIIGQVNAV